MITEADTCRKYVLPKLTAAGWDAAPHSFTEQKTFTDGRILLAGNKAHRGVQKRADYLLRYTRDFTIAVVEAKAAYKSPSDGLQQATDYAEELCRSSCRRSRRHASQSTRCGRVCSCGRACRGES